MSHAEDLMEHWDQSADYWEVFSANHADDADVAAYQALHTWFGGPSVEYGVGLGRVAAKVRPTYGVDFSAEMINRARLRAELGETTLLLGDMSAITLPEQVTYSYVAFSHFNAFTNEDYLFRSFANLRKNSRDGGGLGFDMRTPERYQALDARLGERFLGHSGSGWKFWVTVERLDDGLYSISCDYERLDSDNRLLQRTTVGPFIERAYREDEVSGLLLDAGWEPMDPATCAEIDPYRDSITDRLWVAKASR